MQAGSRELVQARAEAEELREVNEALVAELENVHKLVAADRRMGGKPPSGAGELDLTELL